jgi:mRNA interferase MazF
MTVRRGDIVLLHFPFSDGRGGKARPALVVQSDANNRRLDDTIVALITRTTHRAHREPTQLLIDPSRPEDRPSGLLTRSAVKCEHLLTVEQRLVRRVIGSLPVTMMHRIDGCLKAALGLRQGPGD